MPGKAAFWAARARPRGTPAVGVGARIGWVGQDAEDGDAGGRAPGDLTLGRAMTGPIRQVDIVRGQVTHHAVGAAAPLEDVEDQAQRITHPLVGIEDDLARGAAQEAARQVEAQLAALGLVPAPLLEPRPHDVELSLAHGALEAQQEAVVVEPRVVHAVVVGDEGSGQGADFEQVVPVPAGAREARDLEAEHQADMAEADLGDQPLEAGPLRRRGAGAAEVVVDDDHSRAGPPEQAGPVSERVLDPGRLAVVLELLEGRLPDVDNGQPLEVTVFDLARQCPWLRPPGTAHGRSALVPEPSRGGAAPSARSAPPACGGARLADRTSSPLAPVAAPAP